MIELLEPPRHPNFVSGGFRYHERIVKALGPQRARCITVEPGQLHEHVQATRRADPSRHIVVDGWFAELARRPLPSDATALLHMVPTTPGWNTEPLAAIVTGAGTAKAVRDDARRVDIVRPGVDACFVPAPRANDDGRQGGLALVATGTIGEAKGQIRLIRILRTLPRTWRLTLFGSIHQHPDEVQALRRSATGLPVEIRGAVSSEELAEAYAHHDLFVSLSRSESYGMACAEAATAGLPLLALQTGEIHSFAETGHAWLLDANASDSAIGQQLGLLLKQPHAVAGARRQTRPSACRTWAEAAVEFERACLKG
ncbi:MAG: glycosyltransferase family 4 protein [Planctomycetota bacterium]